jgi:uncharacterized protein (TIGR03086 family)
VTDDILDALGRASAPVADLVGRIRADQWTLPTPCTEWDVRRVVEHLVGMDLVFAAMLGDGPMPDRGADVLGDDPVGAFRRSAAALQEVAARPSVLARTQTTPRGPTTRPERLRWRVVDLLVHGWDLAQATGSALDVPEDLAATGLDLARAQLPTQDRAGRFADPQPVDDGAPTLDLLAAYTGRPVPWLRPTR